LYYVDEFERDARKNLRVQRARSSTPR